MKLTSASFAHGESIPGEFAFAVPHPDNRIELSANRNPNLRWTGVPAGARSLVLLCVDPDAPTSAEDVNRPDREVPAELPRTDFYHWVLIDLPATDGEIAPGSCSDGVTAGGKRQPPGPPGTRQGLNDYTSWFAGDADMQGEYLGYDGPGPPWNDALAHRYHFTLYALDTDRLDVGEPLTGQAVLDAMQGHVLAEARLTGVYSLNPSVRG